MGSISAQLIEQLTSTMVESSLRWTVSSALLLHVYYYAKIHFLMSRVMLTQHQPSHSPTGNDGLPARGSFDKIKVFLPTLSANNIYQLQKKKSCVFLQIRGAECTHRLYVRTYCKHPVLISVTNLILCLWFLPLTT